MAIARHWKDLGSSTMKIFSWIWVKFFRVCPHEWEVIEKIKVYDSSYGVRSELPIATKFILQCKKCGELKAKKL